MPVPKYDVTVFPDGSWHTGITPFPERPDAKGGELAVVVGNTWSRRGW